MKYKCDMVKDLMPLCLDHEASESSSQTVIEHLAECKKCTQYYETLQKEIEPVSAPEINENKYVKLAAKIRKRRILTGILIGIFLGAWLLVCLNYAAGYRVNSRAAADLSGRLNWTSEMIACFEWKDDCHFYIYDSYSCYDVVGVEKTWHGWKTFDNCLNWPKRSAYDENTGVETAGVLCHFRETEGIQIFPVIVYDQTVKTVEVSCFEKTQVKEVKAGEVTLFTFDAVSGQPNTIEATAYDAEGNPVYRLEEQGGFSFWVSSSP